MEAALLPIALAPKFVKAGLAGKGEGLARRAALLAEAGAQAVAIAADVDELPDIHVLFVAGLDARQSARLAMRARAQGVLVNVEDVPSLCDFHVPAIVRRGDLLLTVSTGGRSPGLARLIRQWLERSLGLEWGGRLCELSGAREAWRKQGALPVHVAERTVRYVEERSWLP
ncbi:MAG TPA: NAD(P)-dependent oxidoreductase [Rhizomicrobium sp.]|nr:NAD(P)-dependent oxidoreductase [Rhizomicrobium sp.]